jgi:glycosyltransferase involved in cell wall biosynthesis
VKFDNPDDSAQSCKYEVEMVELAQPNRLENLPFTLTKVIAVIPCYNTQEYIADVIAKTKRYIDEVIVIDDGSKDMTAQVATRAGAVVISHGKNKGYGEALKSCIVAANNADADIMVVIDGDGQHEPDEIPLLLMPISENKADLVIGSRFIANGKHMPKYRKFGIFVINFLWNFGSKVKVSDTQSGFRAYTKKIVKNMQLSEKGMGVSIEILEQARRRQTRIAEVPITCSYEENNSKISKKAFVHGFTVAFGVLRIRTKYSLKNAA